MSYDRTPLKLFAWRMYSRDGLNAGLAGKMIGRSKEAANTSKPADTLKDSSSCAFVLFNLA
jgi:hypothetical protein